MQLKYLRTTSLKAESCRLKNTGLGMGFGVHKFNFTLVLIGQMSGTKVDTNPCFKASNLIFQDQPDKYGEIREATQRLEVRVLDQVKFVKPLNTCKID